jgi:hypothetical protein
MKRKEKINIFILLVKGSFTNYIKKRRWVGGTEMPKSGQHSL